MKSKLILSLAAASILFGSCRKNEDANLDSRATLAYQLKLTDTASTVQGKGASNAIIKWNSGFANPREMRFTANGGENTDYRTINSTQINLFGEQTMPFGHVALPQGSYAGVEMSIKLTQNILAPALQLKGIFTSANLAAPLPVTVNLNKVCELKTEVENVTIDSKNNFAAVTSLDLSQATNGITEQMISEAELTDGTLLITDRINTHIHDMIVENLKAQRHAVQVAQR